MINVSELMVNNWLKDEKGTTFQVNSIEFLGKHTICSTSGLYHELSSCYPIPLTVDILLSAGFEFHHTGSDYYYQKDNLFISQYLNYLIYDFNGDYLWSERMSWVHQVQNLYFSLHQKELTINL